MELKMTDNFDRTAWKKSLADFHDGSEILQSPIWDKINVAAGLKTYRFAWEAQDKIVALALVLESVKAGFKFWYVPRGPICLERPVVWEMIFSDLENKAKEAGAVALRYEPQGWEGSDYGQKQEHIQPSRSLFLDLQKPEEILLSEMHPKTRYNIRLAEKHGVEVMPGEKAEIEDFYHLLEKTTARDGFRGHSLVHYRRLIEESDGAIQLWMAKREGSILAAGIFSFYGGRAVYMHGASADEGREHMAPYLLQWQMIKKSKAEGHRYYDFYGIDEHRWPGVTRFKRGFGGFEKTYPGTFIKAIRPARFAIYTLAARLRRLF